MRDENYMVALRDGEQLLYQVGMRSPIMEEEEGMGAYAAEAVSSMDNAGAGSSCTEPPNLQGEDAEGRSGSEGVEEGNQADKSHIDAEEFANSPLGQKFYAEWKQGRVSPALIGQRFGYHVLGKFASLLEDEREALECANRESVAHGSERASGSAGFVLRPPPAETLVLEDSLEVVGEAGHAVAPSLETCEDVGGAADGVDAGAASTSVSTGSVRTTSPSEGVSEGAGRSKQTSLDKWLL